MPTPWTKVIVNHAVFILIDYAFYLVVHEKEILITHFALKDTELYGDSITLKGLKEL
jgi:hypothetical protein